MSKFWNGIKHASSTSSPASSVGCHDVTGDCDVFCDDDPPDAAMHSHHHLTANGAATAAPTAQATWGATTSMTTTTATATMATTSNNGKNNKTSHSGGCSTSEESTPSSTTPTAAHIQDDDAADPGQPAPAVVTATAAATGPRTDSQSAATRPETVPPSRTSSIHLSSTTEPCSSCSSSSPRTQSASAQSTSPRGSSSATPSSPAAGSTRFARLRRCSSAARGSADLSCVPEEAAPPPQPVPGSNTDGADTATTSTSTPDTVAGFPGTSTAAAAAAGDAISNTAANTTALIDPPAQNVGIPSAPPTTSDNPAPQQQQQQAAGRPLASAPAPSSKPSTTSAAAATASYHRSSSTSSAGAGSGSSRPAFPAQGARRSGHSMPGSRSAAREAPMRVVDMLWMHERNGGRAHLRHASSSLTRTFSSRPPAASTAGPPPMLNRMTSAPNQAYTHRTAYATHQPQSPGELMLLFLLERLCSRAQGTRGYQVYQESILALRRMGILDSSYIPNLSERYRRAFSAVFNDVQDRVDLQSDVGHLDAASATAHTTAPTPAPSAGPAMSLMPQSSASSPTSPTPSTRPLCVPYAPPAQAMGIGPPLMPADAARDLESGPLSLYPVVPAGHAAATPAHPHQQHQQHRLNKRFHRDFVDHEALGTGGFGTVYRARHKIDKCWYAIKAIPLPQSGADNVVSEAEILSRISHNEHVVSYKTTWVEVDDGTLHIPDTEDFEQQQQQPQQQHQKHGSGADDTDTDDAEDDSDGNDDDGQQLSGKRMRGSPRAHAVLPDTVARSCDSDGADTVRGGDGGDADDASDLELEGLLTFQGTAYPGTSSDNGRFTAGTNNDDNDDDDTDDDWHSTFSSEDEADGDEMANSTSSMPAMSSKFFQQPDESSSKSVSKRSVGEADADNDAPNSTSVGGSKDSAPSSAAATTATAPVATSTSAAMGRLSTPPVMEMCQCSITSPPRVGQLIGALPPTFSHPSSPRIYMLSSEDGATPAVGQRSRNTSIDSLKSFDASHPAPSPSAPSTSGVRRVKPKRPTSARGSKGAAASSSSPPSSSSSCSTACAKADSRTNTTGGSADAVGMNRGEAPAPQRTSSGGNGASHASDTDAGSVFLGSSQEAGNNYDDGGHHCNDDDDDDGGVGVGVGVVDVSAEEKENRAGSSLQGTAGSNGDATPPPQTPPRRAAGAVPATPPRQRSLCMVCGRLRAPVQAGTFATGSSAVRTAAGDEPVIPGDRVVVAAARQKAFALGGTDETSSRGGPMSQKKKKKKKAKKKKAKKKRDKRIGSGSAGTSTTKTTGSFSTVTPRRVLGDVNQIDVAAVEQESRWLVPFRKQPDMAPPNLCLFIQMELCQTNLHAWLRQQWEQEHAGVVISRTELPQRMDILTQLLAAINYLHTQKLIHRDIKPQNVLLNERGDGSLHVLLGDFGLARLLHGVAGNEVHSTGSTSAAHTQPGSTGVSSAVGTPPRSDAASDRVWDSSSRKGSASREPAPAFASSPRGRYLSGGNSARFTPRHSGGGVRPSRSRNQYLQDRLSMVAAQQEEELQLQEGRRHHNHISDLHAYAYNRSELTKGLGTETYSSPEQLAGDKYDDRADMYSVGIIILELMCNFRTEMERGFKIRDLKQGRPPFEFMEQYSVQCSWAMALVSKDPSRRLSSRQLLKILQGFDDHLEEEEQEASGNIDSAAAEDGAAGADDVQYTILKSKATIAHYQGQLEQREEDLRKHAEERETLQDQVQWLLDKVDSLQEEVREKRELENQNRDLRFRVERQASVIRRLKSRLVEQQRQQRQRSSAAQ